jgi:hypothetical protein
MGLVVLPCASVFLFLSLLLVLDLFALVRQQLFSFSFSLCCVLVYRSLNNHDQRWFHRHYQCCWTAESKPRRGLLFGLTPTGLSTSATHAYLSHVFFFVPHMCFQSCVLCVFWACARGPRDCSVSTHLVISSLRHFAKHVRQELKHPLFAYKLDTRRSAGKKRMLEFLTYVLRKMTQTANHKVCGDGTIARTTRACPENTKNT